MAFRSLNSQLVVREEYRGWTLYVRWYPSWAMTSEGWLCFPLPPGETKKQGPGLGRFGKSEDAIAAGKLWVDRKLVAPASTRTQTPVGRGRR